MTPRMAANFAKLPELLRRSQTALRRPVVAASALLLNRPTVTTKPTPKWGRTSQVRWSRPILGIRK
jgi:hypothetical protein